MTMTRFDPPGFVEDLLPQHRDLWSQWISDAIDQAQAGNPSDNDGPRPQFFNALKVAPDADAQEKDIAWTAFPRVIQINAASDAARWRRADASRERQDEYCEWSVERDPQTSKIRRVSFTSEGPEYWRVLAEWQPDTVLDLYRQHISPAVRREDLFRNGRYDPLNSWNDSTDRGAMHLIQRNNTLHAEIELAGAATIVRSSGGRILTSAQELIDCSRYGAAERHSDPHIGAVVNELARMGADVTLANPVGLCIAGLATTGWATPDGSDPANYWKVTRGTAQKALRAVYEVPADRGFTVSDIKINGRPIDYGSQIADFITIKLTGLATRIDASRVKLFQGCQGETGGAVPEAMTIRQPRSVSDILGARTPRSRR